MPNKASNKINNVDSLCAYFLIELLTAQRRLFSQSASKVWRLLKFSYWQQPLIE